MLRVFILEGYCVGAMEQGEFAPESRSLRPAVEKLFPISMLLLLQVLA